MKKDEIIEFLKSDFDIHCPQEWILEAKHILWELVDKMENKVNE